MLQRFVESFYKDWDSDDKLNISRLSLQEDKKTIQHEGKIYKSLSAWVVPIWRLDKENLNGRVYSTKLADKIIKENKVTLSLKDHPVDDDGSVKDIVAVFKSPFKKNGILYAECHFVDEEFEKKVVRVIELGGSVGLSSSGLGELKENSNYVKEDSYTLERYSDFVINPSYSVFITNDCKEITESIETTYTIEENTENKTDEKIITIYNIEEKTNEKDTIMNKSVQIPINLLRKNLEDYIEKADSTKDINNRLKAFSEIKEWVEEAGKDKLADLSEKVESEIKDILDKKEELAIKGQKTDTLEETISAKNEILESVKVQLEEITEKYEHSCKMLDELKSYANEYKEMFDVVSGKLNTMVEAKDFVEVKKEVEAKEEEKEEVEEELKKVKESYTSLKSKYESFVESVKREKIAESKRIEAIKKKRLEEKRAKELAEKLELENYEKLEKAKLFKEKEEKNIYQQVSEVESYYTELCERHGADIMDKFKDKILESRTIGDAQIRYFKVRNDIDNLEEMRSKKGNSLSEGLNIRSTKLKKPDFTSYYL